MMCYSVQPRDQIFVIGYGFLSCAKNIGNNIGKNITKNWVVNAAKKFLVIWNNVALKTSKRVMQKNSRSNWWFDWQ